MDHADPDPRTQMNADPTGSSSLVDTYINGRLEHNADPGLLVESGNPAIKGRIPIFMGSGTQS